MLGRHAREGCSVLRRSAGVAQPPVQFVLAGGILLKQPRFAREVTPPAAPAPSQLPRDTVAAREKRLGRG